jgi:hypothetical protein
LGISEVGGDEKIIQNLVWKKLEHGKLPGDLHVVEED